MDNDGKKNNLKLVSLIELPFQHMMSRFTFNEMYNELYM